MIGTSTPFGAVGYVSAVVGTNNVLITLAMPAIGGGFFADGYANFHYQTNFNTAY
jgi:hypothetical protein